MDLADEPVEGLERGYRNRVPRRTKAARSSCALMRERWDTLLAVVEDGFEEVPLPTEPPVRPPRLRQVDAEGELLLEVRRLPWSWIGRGAATIAVLGCLLLKLPILCCVLLAAVALHILLLPPRESSVRFGCAGLQNARVTIPVAQLRGISVWRKSGTARHKVVAFGACGAEQVLTGLSPAEAAYVAYALRTAALAE